MLAAAAAPAPRQGFSSVNALSTLLTMEGLMFTAVNVALGLTVPVEGGRRLLVGPRRLAFGAFWLLCTLAVAATVAWCDLFVSEWPGSELKWLPICGLLVGIWAPPVFAFVIARDVSGDE
jgi:hypothetical protein